MVAGNAAAGKAQGGCGGPVRSDQEPVVDPDIPVAEELEEVDWVDPIHPASQEGSRTTSAAVNEDRYGTCRCQSDLAQSPMVSFSFAYGSERLSRTRKSFMCRLQAIDDVLENSSGLSFRLI